MNAKASVDVTRSVAKPQLIVTTDGTPTGTKVRVAGSQRLLLCDTVEVMVQQDGTVKARVTVPAEFHPATPTA
jgi:hypothetical protein